MPSIMTALLLHIMPSHLCLVQTIVPGNITSLSFSVAPHNEPISLYTSGSGLFSAFCKTRGQSKWSTIDLDHGWLCLCLHSLIYTRAGLAEFVKVGKPRKQSEDFNKCGTELVYLIFFTNIIHTQKRLPLLHLFIAQHLSQRCRKTFKNLP